MDVPVPRQVMVLIDSREKYPLMFPATVRYFDLDGHGHLVRVETDIRCLPFGDYCLADDPHGMVIERKGAVQELIGNLLTSDKRRACAALRRLASGCHNPVLLCDFTLSQLDTEPEVLSCLMNLIAPLRISLLTPGPCKGPLVRRKLGGMIVLMMLAEMLTHGPRRTIPTDQGLPPDQPCGPPPEGTEA